MAIEMGLQRSMYILRFNNCDGLLPIIIFQMIWVVTPTVKFFFNLFGFYSRCPVFRAYRSLARSFPIDILYVDG